MTYIFIDDLLINFFYFLKAVQIRKLHKQCTLFVVYYHTPSNALYNLVLQKNKTYNRSVCKVLDVGPDRILD